MDSGLEYLGVCLFSLGLASVNVTHEDSINLDLRKARSYATPPIVHETDEALDTFIACMNLSS